MKRLLAVSLALFALAACDKVKSAQKELTGGGGSSGGPSAGGGETNPGSTFDKYKEAIAKQDAEALFGLLTGELQQKFVAQVDGLKGALNGGDAAAKTKAEGEVKAMGEDPAAFAKGDSKRLAAKVLAAHVKAHPEQWRPDPETVKAINVDNTKASVSFTTKSGAEGTIKFLKQNGAWRITD